MTLDQLRSLRARQGLRVANASHGKRESEMATYRQLDELVRLNEGGSPKQADGPARCAAVARAVVAQRCAS